ncbi:MAG: hypothetical protein NTY27_07965 [Actinobacteria bacterium]|nr:hypothetical protein [Actinomycetota bacterium]
MKKDQTNRWAAAISRLNLAATYRSIMIITTMRDASVTGVFERIFSANS